MNQEELKPEKFDDAEDLFSSNLRAFEILDDTRMTEEEAKERMEQGIKLLNKPKDAGASKIDEEKIKSFLENVDAKHIEGLVDKLQKFLHGKIQEKISGSKERYEGKLESSLSSLIKLNYGEDALTVLSEIYYRLIKNHPFFDGNKKIAVAFLAGILNQQGLKLNDEEIADITVAIAGSDAKDYAKIIKGISSYLSRLK